MRLYAYLAERERWHTLRELLSSVHGYLERAAANELVFSETVPAGLEKAFVSARKKLTRDIDDLVSLGFPIECREGERKSTREPVAEFRLARAGYAASDLDLSNEQLAVVTVAAALARSASDFPIAADALAAIEKLLPGSSLGANEPVSVSFKVPRTEPRSDVINRRLHRLAEIMRKRHAVEFDYRKLDGSEARRTVELYGLGERMGLWYAVGRDLSDGRVKSFRVSRIVNRPSELRAEQGPQYCIPDDFVLRDHIRPPWRIGKTETLVTVAFDSNVAHLARSMLDGAATQELPGRRVEFTVPVLNVDGLVRWLMTFGEAAEVLAPDSARSHAEEMRAAMEANRG